MSNSLFDGPIPFIILVSVLLGALIFIFSQIPSKPIIWKPNSFWAITMPTNDGQLYGLDIDGRWKRIK